MMEYRVNGIGRERNEKAEKGGGEGGARSERASERRFLETGERGCAKG